MRRRNDDIFQHCENSRFNFILSRRNGEFQMAQSPDEITDVIAMAAMRRSRN